MKRLNQLIQSKEYQTYLQKISDWEKVRQFCCHDTDHFLNVARIAALLAKEEKLDIDKELIYTTAMLHDIGRFMEYETGVEHALASGDIAKHLLEKFGYKKDEIDIITHAIYNHGNKEIRDCKNFSGIFYQADKRSRPCLFCKMEKECSWSKDKKNMEIVL